MQMSLVGYVTTKIIQPFMSGISLYVPNAQKELTREIGINQMSTNCILQNIKTMINKKYNANLSTKQEAIEPATAWAGANFPSFSSKLGAVACKKYKNQ